MNRPMLLALAAAAFAASIAWAQDPPAASNLEDGLEAAKKAGRPLLVVTTWKRGVCNTCDTWQDRVPGDPAVKRQMARFARAQWLYDGLKGKVIPWTRANGGTSDDPAVQVFVVAPDTKAVVRAPGEEAYAPERFAAWLKAQADAWDRAHPATRLAFAAAEVASEGEGAAAKRRCDALSSALESKKPALLFVTRSEQPEADKAAKAQAAASRKLEKGALDSELASKAAEGVLLLKLDLADPDHAAFARTLGVEKAPALLLFAPGDAKPQVLDPAITGDALAYKLRKLAQR